MVHKHPDRILNFQLPCKIGRILGCTELNCPVKCQVAGSNPLGNEISPVISNMGVWFETDSINESDKMTNDLKMETGFTLIFNMHMFEFYTLYLRNT